MFVDLVQKLTKCITTTFHKATSSSEFPDDTEVLFRDIPSEFTLSFRMPSDGMAYCFRVFMKLPSRNEICLIKITILPINLSLYTVVSISA